MELPVAAAQRADDLERGVELGLLVVQGAGRLEPDAAVDHHVGDRARQTSTSTSIRPVAG